MGDQWVTVRYGRRRQRPPQRDRGWDDGYHQGMARAPPDLYGGRAQHSRPNQPVPPFGGNRYQGPQSRSFASVARGDTSRYTRFGPSRQTDNVRQEPTDPKFGRLVRKMHTLIKMVHHLQNVAPKPDKPEPRMISRMVDVLSSMIKPASPNADTEDLIRGNAINWGYNTLLILEEHYTKGLETLIADLKEDLVPDWKPAFEVATRWARRNLSRVTQDVLDHAEALIASSVEGEGEVVVRQEAPPPPQNRTVATQARSSDDIPVAQTTRHAQQQTSPIPIRTVPLIHNPPQVTVTRSVAIMTEQAVCLEEQAESLEGPSILSPPQALPQRQLPRTRGAAQNTCVVSEDSSPSDSDDSSSSSSSSSSPGRAVQDIRDLEISPVRRNLLEEEMMGDNSPVLAPIRDTPLSPSHADLIQIDAPPLLSPSPEPYGGLSPDLFSSPAQQRCKVTRHMNTDRKMIDWDLNVEKKWLIVGDSNLSRIPEYNIPDLQIDSYPGANFRHAQALMAKSRSNVVVEKVVLSFGINSRGQKAKETTVKQMQAAVRTAKRQFPHAEIWVPVVNFSRALPPTERSNLHMLNAHIIRNIPYILALNEVYFQTDSDDIHWTRQTAQKMLEHWASYLNLKAP